jgi:isoamylase
VAWKIGSNNTVLETCWLDWTLLEKHADVNRFLKLLTARRLLRGTGHEL